MRPRRWGGKNTAPERRRLLRNLAMVAALAGRLAYEDLGDAASSLSNYSVAVDSAREAGDYQAAPTTLGYTAQLVHAEGMTAAADALHRAEPTTSQPAPQPFSLAGHGPANLVPANRASVRGVESVGRAVTATDCNTPHGSAHVLGVGRASVALGEFGRGQPRCSGQRVATARSATPSLAPSDGRCLRREGLEHRRAVGSGGVVAGNRALRHGRRLTGFR
ncbi:MAG: hypothetical protein ACRDRO_04705 [Pseudonocardiaceae bacterium]